MDHLLEILKIAEGAIQSDRIKVIAYIEQLIAKLETEGDDRAASRLRKILGNPRSGELDVARFAPNGRIPVDTESRLSLADEEMIALQESEVFLDTDVQKTVEEFLRYVTAADQLLAEGVDISPSLLAYGPPGCGKTELARHISARLQLPLLTARTDSLISSYLGSTAKNLRMIFEHAMKRPCVLFFDEFDAVAKLRDDQRELGELKRVVVSLLQNIDAMDNKTVLIAATNHDHLLDTAIWRRFAYRVRIGLPNIHVRSQLFKKFLGRFAGEKEISLLASASEGLSGSDIQQISADAVRNAILEQVDLVNITEILKRVLKERLPQSEVSTASLGEILPKVRDLNPKVFTYRRLAEIFGISVGKISKLLEHRE